MLMRDTYTQMRLHTGLDKKIRSHKRTDFLVEVTGHGFSSKIRIA